jgi:UDP-glucose 4-epimerase
MSILVTGAGLIGSAAAAMLAARGDKVVLQDIRAPSALPAGVSFVAGDVTDADLVDRVIKEHSVDAILHTAALLSTAMRADPVRGLRVNILGTVGLLEACRRHDLRRIVLISSTTVLYSGFSTLGPDPIPEDAALGLVSQRPGSLYAVSKLTCEQIALLYRDLHGVDTVSLRLAAVVGGDTDAPSSVPGRLFSTLIAGARTDRPVTLDDPLLVWKGDEEFVDVRDCARAAVAALDAERPETGVYNIAHPAQWSLDEVIGAVAKAHGALDVTYDRTVDTGFAGFPHIRPAGSSVEAARRELGFVAAHDLQDSLRHWWAT